MKKRKKMSSGKSKRAFRSGTGVHKKNNQMRPMRGGFRL